MITSASNAKIKRVRALINNKKDRQLQQAYVLEGVRLLEEAVKTGVLPVSVLFSEDLSNRGQKLLDLWHSRQVPMERVLPDILKSVAGTEHTQGIVAEFKLPAQQLPVRWDLLLLLDQLHDPGNVGTLIRTAFAMKVDAVLVTSQTADIYNPKTLRAAMGAHLHLPVLPMDWDQVAGMLNRKVQLVLTQADAEEPCWRVDFAKPTILAIGSEANGLQKRAYQLPHQKCLIPMDSTAESLNAGTAGSILLYEVYRQRNS